MHQNCRPIIIHKSKKYYISNLTAFSKNIVFFTDLTRKNYFKISRLTYYIIYSKNCFQQMLKNSAADLILADTKRSLISYEYHIFILDHRYGQLHS